jgi:Holliday junction resolvase RusA-like endonuclease
MTVVAFSMSGVPRPQGRPRTRVIRQKYAVIYKDPVDADYEKAIAGIAREAMGNRPPLKGPLSVTWRFRMPIPKSGTKRARAAMIAGETAHVSRPDCSNMLKACEDAMNGVVFLDDAQIVRGFFTKVYAERPGIDVRVEAFDD